MFLLSILLQAFFWQRVCSLPLLHGEESKPGIFYYQYAVLMYNANHCLACQRDYSQCKTELYKFVHNDFPDHTVEVADKSFLCGDNNGHNVVLLRLRLCPKEEQGEDSSERPLERMLECSGHLPSDVYFEACTYYTAQDVMVQQRSTFDSDLIAVLVTVFAAVAMLVLGVLMYWKGKKVASFTRRLAAQCRCRCHQDHYEEILPDETPPRSFGSTSDGSGGSIGSDESRLTRAIARLEVIVRRLDSSQSSQEEGGSHQ